MNKTVTFCNNTSHAETCYIILFSWSYKTVESFYELMQIDQKENDTHMKGSVLFNLVIILHVK